MIRKHHAHNISLMGCKVPPEQVQDQSSQCPSLQPGEGAAQLSAGAELGQVPANSQNPGDMAVLMQEGQL